MSFTHSYHHSACHVIHVIGAPPTGFHPPPRLPSALVWCTSHNSRQNLRLLPVSSEAVSMFQMLLVGIHCPLSVAGERASSGTASSNLAGLTGGVTETSPHWADSCGEAVICEVQSQPSHSFCLNMTSTDIDVHLVTVHTGSFPP